MKSAPHVSKLMAEGIAHHVANRFPEAADRYSRVVKIRPQHGEAWRLLGVVALQRGDSAARGLLERAIRINGRDAAAHGALGAVNESDGELESAYAAYTTARTLDATQAAASVGLARVAFRLGRAAEAVAIAEATIARGTVDRGLLRALGGARLLLRNYAGAADAFEIALRIEPHADTYAYLAGAYLYLDRFDEAVAACERALELDPTHAVATFHRGIARFSQGAFAAALADFERAVDFGLEEAHLNLGTVYLLLGDYHAGWRHFGWVTPTRRANAALAALPLWDGSPAPGGRLLVCHEQGVGDTIQMARFLGRARELVGSITLACLPETADLFRSITGVDDVVDMNAPGPLAAYDLWLPTIRLPLVFDVTEATIPAEPYLRPDPERVERFRSRLDDPQRLRVGLVWSGNPAFSRNSERSCGLAELEALNAVPGVSWFALQQGAPSADRPHTGMDVIPINADVADFADTAAIIAQLDLVITVDTSVAHLAGALGRPAWVLLSHQPDWRWKLTGDACPWYPTLRLFRRAKNGSWADVVAAVAAELRTLATGREPMASREFRPSR